MSALVHHIEEQFYIHCERCSNHAGYDEGGGSDFAADRFEELGWTVGADETIHCPSCNGVKA